MKELEDGSIEDPDDVEVSSEASAKSGKLDTSDEDAAPRTKKLKVVYDSDEH